MEERRRGRREKLSGEGGSGKCLGPGDQLPVSPNFNLLIITTNDNHPIPERYGCISISKRRLTSAIETQI